MCTYEVELALEVVKPEVEEMAEKNAKTGKDFWTWNTNDKDLNRAYRPEDKTS